MDNVWIMLGARGGGAGGALLDLAGCLGLEDETSAKEGRSLGGVFSIQRELKPLKSCGGRPGEVGEGLGDNTPLRSSSKAGTVVVNSQSRERGPGCSDSRRSAFQRRLCRRQIPQMTQPTNPAAATAALAVGPEFRQRCAKGQHVPSRAGLGWPHGDTDDVSVPRTQMRHPRTAFPFPSFPLEPHTAHQ